MEHNFQVCYYDNRALTGTSKISAPIFYTFRPGIPIAKDLAIVKERLDCPQNVEGLSLEIEQGGPNLDLNATIEEQVAEWNLIPTDRTTVLCLCTKPSLVVPIYLEELRSGLRQGSWEDLRNLLSRTFESAMQASLGMHLKLTGFHLRLEETRSSSRARQSRRSGLPS
eukprot:m.286215 g.286215  ORF g.286215 m.286215 type:complete len:168 (+) comp40691_c0_seq30:361-864(+)